MIEFLARFKRLLDNKGGIRRVLLDIAFRDHHDILGETKTPQVTIDLLSNLSTVAAIGHDYQSVQIAIRSHLSTGSRPKQDNPQRVYCINDTGHEFVKESLVGFHDGSLTRYS